MKEENQADDQRHIVGNKASNLCRTVTRPCQ
jgi:hypothetical protein